MNLKVKNLLEDFKMKIYLVKRDFTENYFTVESFLSLVYLSMYNYHNMLVQFIRISRYFSLEDC